MSPSGPGRWTVRVAALLVPPGRRERFVREWDAELWHAAREGAGFGAAVGAFADARELRRLERERDGPRRRRMTEWARGWRGEIRRAFRGLARQPVFATAAVVTLALGIGASTAIFTLLDRVVLDPLPYPDGERLVRLANQVPGVGPEEVWNLSTAQYVFLGDEATTLEAVALYRPTGLNVETPSGPRRVGGVRVTGELLPMLGAGVVRGRSLTPEDDRPGRPLVAVVSHGFWERDLGADPSLLGRTLRVDGTPIELVGVLEPGTRLPGLPPDFRVDLWFPLQVDRSGPFGNNHVFPAVGKLAPGADPAAVERELAGLRDRLPERFPDAYSQGFFDRYGFRTVATPLKAYVVGDLANNLWMLFGAVGLVLLVACANVANLFLARMESRRREMAVRSALGAGRGALAAWVMAEALAVSLSGGLLAVLVAYWAVPALVATAPGGIPRMEVVGLGWEAAAFALALSLAVALALGLVPLLRRRTAGPSPVLAGSGRSASAGRDRQRLRSGLVVVQVALALTLVVGAGLLASSVRRLQAVDPGFRPAGVIAVDLHLAGERYAEIPAMWAFYRDVLERVRALPGVGSAGMSTSLPLGGGFGCTVQGFEDPAVYERLEAAGMTTCAGQAPTTPGYLETMGIPVLRGRGLERADHEEPTRGAVVVSRAFAERFWPGEDPIGKGVGPSGRTEAPFYRVVGVVGDVYGESLDGSPALAIYYPVVRIPDTWGYWPTSMTLVVRSPLEDATSLLPSLREAVAGVDPSIPLANAREMEAVVAASLGRRSFASLLLGIAAGVSLLLAAVGLYGVVAYVVSRRTREIGMRLAIGARPGQVVGMIVRRSLRLVALGLVVGAGLALLATRALRGLLYGVEPTDPLAFTAAAGLLAGVAALASWIPARRAAGIDPVRALRSE